MKITICLAACAVFAIQLFAPVVSTAQTPAADTSSASVGASTARGRGPTGVTNFTLTTMAFPDGGEIPTKYASSTSPISPDLEWSNVPEGTVTFVLIFHDPDAALNKTLEDYLHWLVFNIPAATRHLPEGVPATPQLSDGSIQAKPRGNSSGRMASIVGYLGPGAPPGPYHHYTFDLYALDTKLDLGPDATRDDVLKAIDGHILGKAMLIGRFHR